MQSFSYLARRLIALTVSVALLLAPVWPVAASISMANDAAHTLHAQAQDLSGAGAMHTGHDMAANSPCDQHETCNQLCCSTCVQCSTAALTAPARFSLAHPIQSSTVPRLHDRLTVAPHLRPPAA